MSNKVSFKDLVVRKLSLFSNTSSKVDTRLNVNYMKNEESHHEIDVKTVFYDPKKYMTLHVYGKTWYLPLCQEEK